VSSDPRTFRELGLFWRRYHPEVHWEEMGWERCERLEPTESWVLIDVAARRIVFGDEEEAQLERGGYQRDKGEWHADIPLAWFNPPAGWECLAEQNPEEALVTLPIPQEPIDFRGILFGRKMTEDLAVRMSDLVRTNSTPAIHVDADDFDWEAGPSKEELALAQEWYKLTMRVHKEWLMTRRTDLDHRTPREYLHQNRVWADQEVTNREREWIAFQRRPQPLDRDTFSYRFGAMTRTEVVLYFDLCRAVIAYGWKLLCQEPEISIDLHAAKMYDYLLEWLQTPTRDTPETPGRVIDQARQHMPIVAESEHFDCECPICRMMAEGELGDGPTFHVYSGFHLNMDDEFAFSLTEDYEEWKAENAWMHEEVTPAPPRKARRDNAKAPADVTKLALARLGRAGDDDEFDSVWTRSGGTGFESSFVSLLGLGFRLAEIVADLQEIRVHPRTIEELNVAFDAVRHQADDRPKCADAIAKTCALLEELAADHPVMTSKAADFQSQLAAWARQQTSGSGRMGP
ncbi:MAG: hypothetical protein KDA60_22090, partial [Planctomycetales bacterium]|nr:hypothetical protein [Planctomycetales bacterium]